MGYWVLPTCRLVVLENKKIPFPCRHLNPGQSSPYPGRCAVYTVPAHIMRRRSSEYAVRINSEVDGRGLF